MWETKIDSSEVAEFLDRVGTYPFYPLYNLGERTYKLTTKRGNFNVREGSLELKPLPQNLEIPKYIKLDAKVLNSFLLPSFQSSLNKLKSFEKTETSDSIIVNYLVGKTLGLEGQLSADLQIAIAHAGAELDLDAVLSAQMEFRGILKTINTELMKYMPYPSVEALLLSLSTDDEENFSHTSNLQLSDLVTDSQRVVIEKEYKEFMKFIKLKDLNVDERKVVISYLLLFKDKGILKEFYPYPYHSQSFKKYHPMIGAMSR